MLHAALDEAVIKKESPANFNVVVVFVCVCAIFPNGNKWNQQKRMSNKNNNKNHEHYNSKIPWTRQRPCHEHASLVKETHYVVIIPVGMLFACPISSRISVHKKTTCIYYCITKTRFHCYTITYMYTVLQVLV